MFTQNNSFQEGTDQPFNNTRDPAQPGQAELEPYVPQGIYQGQYGYQYWLIQTAKIGIAAFVAPAVVNNPPFSSQERTQAVIQQEAYQSQTDPWQYVLPDRGARQPYGKGTNQPPLAPAWQPVSVSQNQVIIQQLAYQAQPDPWAFVFPQKGSRQPYGHGTYAPIPTAVTYVPFNRNWLSTVLSSWQLPDPQPILPKQLSPAIPGQSINNPPFNGRPLHQTYSVDYILVQNAKSFPFIVPGIKTPYVNSWLNTVLAIWNPDTVHNYIHAAGQPYDYRKLNPQITAVPVNNPPFSNPGNTPLFAQQGAYQAQPDPWIYLYHKAGQPYDYGKLIQPSIPAYIPFSRNWLGTVLNSWQLPDPLPILPKQNSPAIPGQSVNNPPPNQDQLNNLAGVIATWNPDIVHNYIHKAKQPYDYAKNSPGIPGMSVDNPPSLRRVQQLTEVPYQQPPDPLPQRGPLLTQVPAAQGQTPYSNTWLVSVLTAWNPEFVHNFIHRAGQPYDYAKLSPQITAVPVNNPPFSSRIPLIDVLGPWQPSQDPLPQTAKPLTQGFVSSVQVSYSGAWQATVLRSWQPHDPLPTLPKQMSPGIPGMSIDNPPLGPLTLEPVIPSQIYPWVPFYLRQAQRGTSVGGTWVSPIPTPPIVNFPPANEDQLVNLMQIITGWQPDYSLLPQLPRNLSPAITGVRVDNPPGIMGFSVVSFPDAPLPQTSPKFPQPFVQIIQTPYANYWQATILAAWNPDPTHQFIHRAGQPYDYQKLPIQITAVPVNNPPFSSRTELPGILYQWQPDQGPLPQIAPKTPQGVVVTVKGPFNNLWLVTVLNAWQPDLNILPTLPKNMSPGIPGMSIDNPPGIWQQVPFEIDDGLPQIYPNKLVQGVPVNNPPFTYRERIENTYRIITNAWLPPDPLPTLNVKFNFGVRVDNPPFTHFGRTATYNQIVYTTWIPPDPLPTLTTKLTPPSTDNPPFTGRDLLSNIIVTWQPPDPQYIHRAEQPYDYLKMSPGIPGMSIDNPPFIHPARTVPLNEIVQNAWLPPDPLPTLNIKFTAGTRIDNPPFTYGGRTVQYAQIVYNAWIPPDPLPTLNIKLPPVLSAVAVNNPPFSHRGRDPLPNILLYWQPPDPLPTPSVTLKVVISGSAVPKHVFEWLQRYRRRGRR